MYTYPSACAMNAGHPEGRVIARLQLMRELERGARIRSVARRYKMSPSTVRRWGRCDQEEGDIHGSMRGSQGTWTGPDGSMVRDPRSKQENPEFACAFRDGLQEEACCRISYESTGGSP